MYGFTAAARVVFLQMIILAATQTASQKTAIGPQQNCSVCSNTYAAGQCSNSSVRSLHFKAQEVF